MSGERPITTTNKRGTVKFLTYVTEEEVQMLDKIMMEDPTLASIEALKKTLDETRNPASSQEK